MYLLNHVSSLGLESLGTEMKWILVMVECDTTKHNIEIVDSTTL